MVLTQQERKRKTVNLTLPLAPLPQYTWDNGLVRKDGRPGSGATDAGSSLAMLWSELGGTDAFSSPSTSPDTPGTPLPSSAIIIGEEGVERLLRSPRTPSAPPRSAIPAYLSNPNRASSSSPKSVQLNNDNPDCSTPTSSSSDCPPLSDDTLVSGSEFGGTPITAICLTTPLASKQNLLAGKARAASVGSRSIDDFSVRRLLPRPGYDSPIPSAMSFRESRRIRDQPDVPVDWVC